MINNFKVFSKEFINTKLYCLVIEGREYTTLSVQLARSLEEAFFLAKREFVSKNPHLEEKMIGAKIGLFEIKEIPELFFGSAIKTELNKPNISLKRKVDDKKSKNKENLTSQKNKFLKFVIDSQNMEILKKNKNLFTENEIKYVQEQIIKDKKNKEK